MTDATTAMRPTPARPRGQDELNLIDFPISGLQYQQPSASSGKRPDELVCVIEAYDADLQKVVPRKLTRRTSSRHGFPTPLEDEVLVGLLSLTHIRNAFSAPRVEFQNGELFDLMGWPQNGNSNARLGVALDRLTGLSLKYENSWTTEDGIFEKEFTTGLLESYRFVRQTGGKPSEAAERSWVQWASEVFADIRRGNVKELDAAAFFSLRLPLARRMYRFLDKSLSQASTLEMDLSTFAAHLGLSETRHVGKIKERLSPALAELETLPGFLAAASPESRFRKRGPGAWIIRAERPSSATFDSEATPTASRTAERVPSGSPRPRSLNPGGPAAHLVREFYHLWTAADDHVPTPKETKQAQMLIDRYGADEVHEMLPRVIDAMRRQFPDAKAFGASFLYWPEAARSAARRKHEAERTAAAHEHARAERDQQSENSARRKRLLTTWNALSPARQDAIRTAVAATASATVRQFIAVGKHDDPLVMLACFDELERRTAA